MPRGIPSFPDSFNSWNYLSSIGSGIAFLSFGCLCREPNEFINEFLSLCSFCSLISLIKFTPFN